MNAYLDSSSKCNKSEWALLWEDFVWGSVGEFPSWAVVQFVNDSISVLLGVVRRVPWTPVSNDFICVFLGMEVYQSDGRVEVGVGV